MPTHTKKMKSLIVVGTLVLAGVCISQAREPLAAEVEGPAPRLGPAFPDLVRLDGSKLATSTVPLTGGGKTAGGAGADRLTGPTPTSIVDGWTRFVSTPDILDEDYNFSHGDSVVFSLMVKVGSAGFPGLCADFLIVPSGTSSIPPVPSQVLLIDDVSFAPSGASSTVLVATVTVPGLEAFFAPGSCIDWFVVVDFDDSDNPDTDGDTFPDCGVELPPSFVDFGGSDLDEFGAGVLDFFNPGGGPLKVNGPHPPAPASKGVGVKSGETGETRPWSFTLAP